MAFVGAVRVGGKCGVSVGPEEVCSAPLNCRHWCVWFGCVAVETKFCIGGAGWCATVLATTMPNGAEKVRGMIGNAGVNKMAGYW